MFGDNIGSGAGSTRYFQTADNPLPSGVSVVQIPFDCRVVAMAVTYLETSAAPLVFDSGKLQFRLGRIMQGAPAESTSFTSFSPPRALPANTATIEWGAEVNNTHPTTMRSDLNVFLRAGTLLCAQSVETGVINVGSSSAEVGCSIWLASNTPVKDLSGLK